MKAFYEYLLNREYAEPLSLDHTMERKGVRSPSMRLRFGRRSDPDVPLRVCNLWYFVIVERDFLGLSKFGVNS